jgi:hypothetical protein
MEDAVRHRSVSVSCIMLGLVIAWGLAVPAEAYEQHSNTLSLGIQGGPGLMIGSDGAYHWNTAEYRYSDYSYGSSYEWLKFWENNWGYGVGIRIRYSLDPTHAIGVSFEDLRFNRHDEAPADAPGQYQVNNYMADYYLYFNRRAKTCPYVVLGAGFHRDTFRVSDAENVIVPESFVTNFGVGVEYFVGWAFAVDFAARAYYLQGSGGHAIASEALLGFQYYLLR